MEQILDRKSKSEVIGRCGGDEKPTKVKRHFFFFNVKTELI